MLRPRHIKIKKFPTTGIKIYEFDVIERVCRICLNRQKREWDTRHIDKKLASKQWQHKELV